MDVSTSPTVYSNSQSPLCSALPVKSSLAAMQANFEAQSQREDGEEHQVLRFLNHSYTESSQQVILHADNGSLTRSLSLASSFH